MVNLYQAKPAMYRVNYQKPRLSDYQSSVGMVFTATKKRAEHLKELFGRDAQVFVAPCLRLFKKRIKRHDY